MSETNEVSFVTKRYLITFTYAVAVIADGTVLNTHVVIGEITEKESAGRRYDIPAVRIVGLPDRRKFTKSYILHLPGISAITAMIELDDDDLR